MFSYQRNGRRNQADKSSTTVGIHEAVGGKWTRAFLKRLPQLKTKLAIEAERVTDVTREQVLNFNDKFRQVIHEKKIQLKNIYNSDETVKHSTQIELTVGSSIGTCNGINLSEPDDIARSLAGDIARSLVGALLRLSLADAPHIPFTDIYSVVCLLLR